MKILLIKLSAIGDVLATTPFFRLIKEDNPECKIHHLVMNSSIDATINNPFIDEHIVVSNLPSNNSLKDIYSLIILWIKIISGKYDMALIGHKSKKISWLCKLAGIKKIIAFSSYKSIELSASMPYRTDINRTIQEYELYKLSGLKIKEPTALEFYIDLKKIKHEKFNNLPDRFITISLGGGNFHSNIHNRRLPVEKYHEIIKGINIPVILLGQGTEDLSYAEDLIKTNTSNMINFVNKTNLNEAAYLIKKSIVFIGNDSGLLYLASAVNSFAIGIFGPTDPGLALPLGQRVRFIQSDIKCSPCYNPNDGLKGQMYACKNNICMQSINTYQVIQLANNIIEE